MKIITLLNEKGGVGKTTLATHIAAGLAIRGARVVLVDADPQGHATVSLGESKEAGLYELLVRDADFEDVLLPIAPTTYAPHDESAGQFFLVPSNVETRLIPLAISDAMLFKERFEQLEDAIDVVVVDTSPTPSLLHGSIYLATDGIIYPTECEHLSLDGLASSLRHKDMARTMRDDADLEDIKVIGIVPNKYRVNTLAHDYGIKTLVQQFKRLVWPALPLRTAWQQASWAKKTIFNFAPDEVATEEAWALIDRVEMTL